MWTMSVQSAWLVARLYKMTLSCWSRKKAKNQSSLKSCTVWRKVGQTNVQTSSRTTRKWKTCYALNMAAYSMGHRSITNMVISESVVDWIVESGIRHPKSYHHFEETHVHKTSCWKRAYETLVHWSHTHGSVSCTNVLNHEKSLDDSHCYTWLHNL